jgi:hypothetical protein
MDLPQSTVALPAGSHGLFLSEPRESSCVKTESVPIP